VKGLFLMVPHEEHETTIFPIYDDIIGATYYLHFQQHSLLPYDETHLHRCNYDVHLSHLKTHDFPCSLLSSVDMGGTSSTTWVKRYMNGANYYWQHHPLLFLDNTHVHRCTNSTYVSPLKAYCFPCSLLGSHFSGGSVIIDLVVAPKDGSKVNGRGDRQLKW
jgi:hypothetical protein